MENYGLGKEELEFFRSLDTPPKIQDFLNSIPYNQEKRNYPPKKILERGRADCLEGALLAATARRVNGYEPLVVELTALEDEEHIVAVYRFNNRWGAMGKSKFLGLTYREPIFRTIRELVVSYFEFYFNDARKKTLREYTLPLNLKKFDNLNWIGSEEGLEAIEEYLNEIPHFKILPDRTEEILKPVDPIFPKRLTIEKRLY